MIRSVSAGLLSVWLFLILSCAAPKGYDLLLAPPQVGERAVWYARKYIEASARYEWGGQDPLPKIVVDCSGLVIRCYAYATQELGYVLLFDDTTAAGLQRYTVEISLQELRPGDLLFMGTSGAVTHVALFVRLEDDRIVFIDSTYKPEEGINGVSERSYPQQDLRFLSFGRLWIGKP